MMKLTRKKLMSFLFYDPFIGSFVWRVAPSNRAKIGGRAGHINGQGYREIELRGRVYQSHRVAWLFVNGRWPHNEIDHVNGDRLDNRIDNLREATKSQNQHNRRRWTKPTSSRFKGVSFHKPTGKWCAHIQYNNARKHLGLFDTEELAAAARRDAAIGLHGRFARN